MIKLSEYAVNKEDTGKSSILEYRTPGSKNKKSSKSDGDNEDHGFHDRFDDPSEVSDEYVVVGGKKVKKDSPEYAAALKKQDEGDALDKKVKDDDFISSLDPKKLSINEREVSKKITRNEPFFIIGHAGWAKTSIVRRFAKKFGFDEVLEVHLHQVAREDVNGIPLPEKDEKSGEIMQRLALPWWATEIIQNQDKDYLLFFDEINQAPPQVMNTLMPIVLDNKLGKQVYDNFICGSAGNYKSENDSIEDIPGPLMSRFGHPIIWNDNTEEAWSEQLDFWKSSYTKPGGLFKEAYKLNDVRRTARRNGYDEEKFKKFCEDILPDVKSLLEAFTVPCQLFYNPRDLTNFVFFSAIKQRMIVSAHPNMMDLSTPKEIFHDIWGGSGTYGDPDKDEIHDSLIRKQFRNSKDSSVVKKAKDAISKLAEDISKFVAGGIQSSETQKSTTGGRSANKKKDIKSMISQDTYETIEQGMTNGVVSIENEDGTIVQYAVSKESIYHAVANPEVINAEMLHQLIRQMKAEGKQFKYNTDDECIKAHPNYKRVPREEEITKLEQAGELD